MTDVLRRSRGAVDIHDTERLIAEWCAKQSAGRTEPRLSSDPHRINRARLIAKILGLSYTNARALADDTDLDAWARGYSIGWTHGYDSGHADG